MIKVKTKSRLEIYSTENIFTYAPTSVYGKSIINISQNSILEVELNLGNDFVYKSYGYTFIIPKESAEIISDNNKIMNIKEKFVLMLTEEPQKSFRKTGITNGDDLLTEEGQKIFLSWLLHKKFADDFKKEVVEDLLEEIKKEEKK